MVEDHLNLEKIISPEAKDFVKEELGKWSSPEVLARRWAHNGVVEFTAAALAGTPLSDVEKAEIFIQAYENRAKKRRAFGEVLKGHSLSKQSVGEFVSAEEASFEKRNVEMPDGYREKFAVTLKEEMDKSFKEGGQAVIDSIAADLDAVATLRFFVANPQLMTRELS